MFKSFLFFCSADHLSQGFVHIRISLYLWTPSQLMVLNLSGCYVFVLSLQLGKLLWTYYRFVYLVVLRLKPRAWYMLENHSATKPLPSPLSTHKYYCHSHGILIYGYKINPSSTLITMLMHSDNHVLIY